MSTADLYSCHNCLIIADQTPYIDNVGIVVAIVVQEGSEGSPAVSDSSSAVSRALAV